MNALDCALKFFNFKVPIIYVRLIWFQLWFLVYLVLILLGYFIKIKFKFRAAKLHVLTTSVIFLFIYLQPDIITLMVSLLSCRTILNKKYILANISFACYEGNYYDFTLGLVLPLFLVWIIIFPLTIFIIINKNKNQLQSLVMQLKYGILYKEYKPQNFYWEFVKIYKRILLILALNYYIEEIKIKALLIFSCITLYSICQIRV